MMKKTLLLTIFAAFMLIFAQMGASASETELLGALEIIPESMSSASADTAAAKGELAYIAAKLSGSGEASAKNTAFSDVTEKQEYSGYVEFAAEAGLVIPESEKVFGYETGVTTAEAAKVMIDIMGYSHVAQYSGGYPAGYLATANRFRLFDDAEYDKDGYLTKQGMLNVIYKTLTAEKNQFKYGADGVSIDSTVTTTLLVERFGISVYDVFVADTKEGKITANIEKVIGKNKNKNNTHFVGESVPFKASSKLNTRKYKNTYARIWVNGEDEILCISMDRSTKVVCGYIYAVNNDVSTSSRYAIGGMNEIMVVNDDEIYEVSEKAGLEYNGKVTAAPVAATGNFARIVITNEEITYMEIWTLSGGGIIEKTTGGKITYIDHTTVRVEMKLENYENTLVFIDGEMRNISELKSNSVFEYTVLDGKNLVISASEKVITGIFEGMGDDTIRIEKAEYLCGSICYKEEKAFKAGGDVKALLKETVNAYFDPYGRCRFVEIAGERTVSREFMAAVNAISSDIWGKVTIQVLTLEGTYELKVYECTEKLKLSDGITLQSLNENKNDVDGNGIYTFKVNSEDKITEICKAPYLQIPGYGDAIVNNAGTFKIGHVHFNSKLFFYPQDFFTVLYKDKNGDLGAENIGITAFYDKTMSGTILRLFGDIKTDNITAKIMCGNTDEVHFWQANWGLISDTIEQYDEKTGETFYQVRVGDSKNGAKYRISSATGETLPKNAIVSYYGGLVRGENNILIKGTVIDLTEPFSSIENNPEFMTGTVTHRSSSGIWFGEDNWYPLHGAQVYLVDDGSAKRFTGGTIMDINVGDKITCYVTSGDVAIRVILKEKE